MGAGSDSSPTPTAEASLSRPKKGRQRSDFRAAQVRRDSSKSSSCQVPGVLVLSLQPPLFYSTETLRDILSTDVSTRPPPVGFVLGYV